MSTVPKHEVVVKRARIAKARAEWLSSYVGGAYTLDSDLYPRRRGQLCTVISYNRDVERVPLVVQWADGWSGVASPEQLREIAQ